MCNVLATDVAVTAEIDIVHVYTDRVFRDLSSNQLSGTIPEALTNSPKLTNLYVERATTPMHLANTIDKRSKQYT
jgi:hypothetical protein